MYFKVIQARQVMMEIEFLVWFVPKTRSLK